MNKYILIVENEDGTQTVEGFFNSVKECKNYIKNIDIIFADFHIYELIDNAYDLAQDD